MNRKNLTRLVFVLIGMIFCVLSTHERCFSQVVIGKSLPYRYFPENGMNTPDGSVRIKPIGEQLWIPVVIEKVEGKDEIKANINTGYIPKPVLTELDKEAKVTQSLTVLLKKNREAVQQILRQNYAVECKVTSNVVLDF